MTKLDIIISFLLTCALRYSLCVHKVEQWCRLERNQTPRSRWGDPVISIEEPRRYYIKVFSVYKLFGCVMTPLRWENGDQRYEKNRELSTGRLEVSFIHLQSLKLLGSHQILTYLGMRHITIIRIHLYIHVHTEAIQHMKTQNLGCAVPFIQLCVCALSRYPDWGDEGEEINQRCRQEGAGGRGQDPGKGGGPVQEGRQQALRIQGPDELSRHVHAATTRLVV